MRCTMCSSASAQHILLNDNVSSIGSYWSELHMYDASQFEGYDFESVSRHRR